MKNAKTKDMTPLMKHLFWWVPEDGLPSLSADVIVESVLNNGNEDTVRQLLDFYGIETVAEIFKRQTERRRINYRPRTLHFFRAYFRRHAPSYEDNHVQEHSDKKSG
jgi:hypothetical protein